MADPWIRVHADLFSKPVVGRCARALSVSPQEAMGCLVMFWGNVSRHATNGRIADYEDDQLDRWAGWPMRRGQRRGAFAKFVRDHHMDAEGRVNEWTEYAGALEARREKERERLRNKRQLLRNSEPVVAQQSGDVREVLQAARANETIRNELIDDDECAGAKAEKIDDPGVTPLRIAVWANKAMTEKWGEPTTPFTPGQSVEMAQALVEAGVEPGIAHASIYRQCRDSRLPTPPSHPSYFRKGILADWERVQAKRATDANADPPPVHPPPGSDGAVTARVARPTIDDRLAKWARDTAEKEARQSLLARAGVILQLAQQYGLLRWNGNAGEYAARQRDAAKDPRAPADFLDLVPRLRLHSGIGDQSSEHFAAKEIAERIAAVSVATVAPSAGGAA